MEVAGGGVDRYSMVDPWGHPSGEGADQRVVVLVSVDHLLDVVPPSNRVEEDDQRDVDGVLDAGVQTMGVDGSARAGPVAMEDVPHAMVLYLCPVPFQVSKVGLLDLGSAKVYDLVYLHQALLQVGAMVGEDLGC